MNVYFTFSRKVIFVAVFLILFLGTVGNISAQKVRLRSKITPTCTGTANSRYADIYADGNIAVQGSYSCRGVFIYDISNPDAPTLASWYNPGSNLQFLEAIVVGNRGYFGSGNGGGVHIVDLSNPASPQLLGIVNSTNGNAFNSIHEMVVVGNYLIENFNGFSTKILKVINISNPANPVFVRDINPTEISWVHAMHIRGNKMFTSGWGNSSVRGRTEIYDITNIGTQAPTMLGYIEDATSVTSGNSMHSSWSSEDGNYLYSCRETNNGNADLRTYDIRNPAQPLLVNRLGMNDLALNAVSPHNPVVKGNYLYVSWYQAGLQVFDISNPAHPTRVGQYDTTATPFVENEDSRAQSEEPWDMFCGSTRNQNALPTSYDGNWAVFPFLGEDKILLGDLRNGLILVDVTDITAPTKNNVSDFDGDGKTDFSTYTPNTGLWQIENSSDNSVNATRFGAATDKIVAGDYDGDGKSDIAVFRPENGFWYVFGSSAGYYGAAFGANGDIPVAADYDADGKTDFAVFRPANGTWYVQQSTMGFRGVQWGTIGDKPIIGDFEGDGKSDFAVWRPSSGVWYVMKSSSGLMQAQAFGQNTDKPLSGDFDGDGKFDYAVYRPESGTWYILGSQTNSLTALNFGDSNDIPIPADYDGDERADISVFRPNNNIWYRLNSTNGAFQTRVFGQSGVLPSPSSAQAQ